MSLNTQCLLFSGTSHPGLAKQVASKLGVNLGKISIETFPDGEIGVQILENVRGRDVFVLQTIARRPNSYLLEMLIIVDALKRSSARSVTVIVPYFGYARQDRKDKGRVPITAKLVANLIEKSGVDRVLTIDLHADQVQGFFDIPVDNLSARHVLVERVKSESVDDLIVVAPDVGSIKIARAFSVHLQVDLAIVDKRRVHAGHVEAGALIGDVKGRNVLLVDDICSTAGTLKNASLACKQAGAKAIFAAVSHALFVGDPFSGSAIEKMFVTDTIAIDLSSYGNKVEVVSVDSLLANAVDCVMGDKSISCLFT